MLSVLKKFKLARFAEQGIRSNDHNADARHPNRPRDRKRRANSKIKDVRGTRAQQEKTRGSEAALAPLKSQHVEIEEKFQGWHKFLPFFSLTISPPNSCDYLWG